MHAKLEGSRDFVCASVLRESYAVISSEVFVRTADNCWSLR